MSSFRFSVGRDGADRGTQDRELEEVDRGEERGDQVRLRVGSVRMDWISTLET